MERQTSTFPVQYQLDSVLPGEHPKLTLRFPLKTLDFRRRFFTEESFAGSFEKRPQLLWTHDMWALPFGSITEVVIEDGFLVGRALFADTQMAHELLSLLSMEPPAIQSMSIGWMSGGEQTVAWKDGGKAILQTDVTLMDMSLVNFGGMKGTEVQMDIQEETDRMVPKHGGRTKDTDSWDGDAAVGRLQAWASDGDDINFSQYEEGFAVVEGDPENLGSYHFPHHDVDGDGLFVSKAGVVAAWAAAKGARSGQTNEDAQQHLSGHREQFGLTEGGLLTRWVATNSRIDRLAGEKPGNMERS